MFNKILKNPLAWALFQNMALTLGQEPREGANLMLGQLLEDLRKWYPKWKSENVCVDTADGTESNTKASMWMLECVCKVSPETFPEDYVPQSVQRTNHLPRLSETTRASLSSPWWPSLQTRATHLKWCAASLWVTVYHTQLPNSCF